MHKILGTRLNKISFPYFFILKVVIKLFWLGLIIGLVLGANISLFLYAMIIAGKESERKMNKDEN